MRSDESFAARSKWPTVVAMVVLLGGTALGWNWIWGIFFLVWSVQGIASGQAFVLQMVYRDENPVLFWVVSLSWLVLAVMTVVYDIFPQIAPQFAADWLGVLP